MEDFEGDSEENQNKKIKFEVNSMFLDDLFEGSRKICDKMILDTRTYCDERVAITDKFNKKSKFLASFNFGLTLYWVYMIYANWSVK